MQIKKILWASDGSKESLEALKWVVIFATRYGAKITALNVIESPNISPLKVSNDLKRDISLIDSVMGKREARRLDGVHKVLRKKGIKVEARVTRGAPPQEIVNAAQSHAVDLIAMAKEVSRPGAECYLGARPPLCSERRTCRLWR